MTFENPTHARLHQARLGTFLLFGGLVLLVLRGVQVATGLPGMPRFWYTNQSFWWIIAGGLVSSGIYCLSPASAPALSWRPSRPGIRFRHLVVYTRAGCHLCDEALELLAGYRRWLPVITEHSIDRDPQLIEKYGECVPVVVFDGKVRFRGRVSPALLERLIEGTPPF